LTQGFCFLSPGARGAAPHFERKNGTRRDRPGGNRNARACCVESSKGVAKPGYFLTRFAARFDSLAGR
jgi:hypothetical protein